MLPSAGKIFLSVSDGQKEQITGLAKRLAALGYELMATDGTARRLEEADIPVEHVKKLAEGQEGEEGGNGEQGDQGENGQNGNEDQVANDTEARWEDEGGIVE